LSLLFIFLVFLNNLLWISFFIIIKIRISIIFRLILHVVGGSLGSSLVALWFLRLHFLFFFGKLLFIFVDYVILIRLALTFFLWSRCRFRCLLFLFNEFRLRFLLIAISLGLIFLPFGNSSLEFIVLLHTFLIGSHLCFGCLFGILWLLNIIFGLNKPF